MSTIDTDQSELISNIKSFLQLHYEKIVHLITLRSAINENGIPSLNEEILKHPNILRKIYPPEMSPIDSYREQQRLLRYAYDQFMLYKTGETLWDESLEEKHTYNYLVSYMKSIFSKYARQKSELGELCKITPVTGEIRLKYNQIVRSHDILNKLFKTSNHSVKHYCIFTKQAVSTNTREKLSKDSSLWEVKLFNRNKYFTKQYTTMTIGQLVEYMKNKDTYISNFDEDTFSHDPPKEMSLFVHYGQRTYQYAEKSKKQSLTDVYSVKATRAYNLLREIVLDNVNIGQITLSLIAKNQYAIQDGQQRLYTVYAFVNDKMLVPDNIFDPISNPEELRKKIKYNTPSKYFSEMSEENKIHFLNIAFSVCLINANLNITTLSERMRILNYGFYTMNSGRLNLTVDEQKKAEIPKDALICIDTLLLKSNHISKLEMYVPEEKSELLSYIVRIIGLLNNKELKSNEDFLDNGINYLYEYCKDPELTELSSVLIAMENALKVFNEQFEVFSLIKSTRSSSKKLLTFKKAYFETNWVTLTEELLLNQSLYKTLLETSNFMYLRGAILKIKSDPTFIGFCSEHTNSKSAIEAENSGRFPIIRKIYTDAIENILNNKMSYREDYDDDFDIDEEFTSPVNMDDE